MKRYLLFLLFFSATLVASPAIQLIKKENNDSNKTLLVIGGIHGNEPGGYFAAAILAMHYKITSKNLWIVPNLNSESIIQNKRGIHGDMNRKFAHIDKHDKDKPYVEAIKKVILDPKVSLVLNLHDGHGFYRSSYKGSIFNPNAWGQTCVIDQCSLDQNQSFGNLNDIALQVRDNVNKKLLAKHHQFNVKNTKTKYIDEQMQLSLTYFAVTHNKPAFAIETSKSLSSLSQKVFYQLLAIEEYMKIMGIKYKRDFSLNESELSKIINNYGSLEINDNILIQLSNIKKTLSFVPIKSNNNDFHFSHPLGKIKRTKGEFLVFIGNKLITTLKPQFFKMDHNCKESFELLIDGQQKSTKKASTFFVMNNFKVLKEKKYRVNIIGFSSKKGGDESGVTISLKDMHKHYSIDKDAKIYRVEFYKEDNFCSMLMVQFK
ncbi:MAG: succinylglutamate desuccinylase/aspartoacylase family protein [Epsilonproteobacteria bacterium]|nr:succinylglutamate desuccinylase/aspartoacylase family protein [Campylobacterota bacterium]